MANDARDPLDLLLGGALIALNLGLTAVGASQFGGGAVGLAVYLGVPGLVAWAVSRVVRRRRRAAPAP